MNIKNKNIKINIKSSAKHISIFIIMLLVILAFSTIFGKNNAIIGLSSILLAFLLLKKDISKNLLKNSTKIILINLIIGIAAFLAWEIPELSFVIVFIILFLTCILTKDISEKIYLPFVYEFVFILSQPIPTSGLSIRLVSLIIGSLLVIGINILFHKLKNKNKNKDKNEDEDENEDKSEKYGIKENVISKFQKNKNHYLFSIELAILIAIFEFMTIYLKIPDAKWLSYIAVTLIWPNIDLKIKSYGKIKGYIKGIIIFIIIDLLFLNPFLNVNLTSLIPNFGNYILIITILISAYLYLILTLKSAKYSKRVTFSALLSLSLAYLSIPPSNLILEKFIFVVIGTLICLGVNYLLRRSLKIEV